MRKITGHTTRTAKVVGEDQQEHEVEVVQSVDWIDHTGSVHHLEFHPAGTNVAPKDEPARVVGEHVYDDGSVMPEHNFATPEEAVLAFEHGKIS